jgi:hypothetical protein
MIMPTDLIEWSKQVAPAFTLIGIGLAIAVQGSIWATNAQRKLWRELGFLYGITIIGIGVYSLLFTDAAWIRQRLPAAPIWAICLPLLFQGSKWIKEPDKKIIGWFASVGGFLLFVGGLFVQIAASWNFWIDLIALLVAIAAVILGLRSTYKST